MNSRILSKITSIAVIMLMLFQIVASIASANELVQENTDQLNEVYLKVVDADNNEVQGLEINVTNGTEIMSIVTADTYTKNVMYLNSGSYSIVENEDFSIVNGENFNVDFNQQLIEIQVKTKLFSSNEEKANDQNTGRFDVRKADNYEVALAGAEFTFYDANNIAADVIKTDQSGRAETKELPYGKYTVVEIKTPVGYENGGDVYTETISENEPFVSVNDGKSVINKKMEIE